MGYLPPLAFRASTAARCAISLTEKGREVSQDRPPVLYEKHVADGRANRAASRATSFYRAQTSPLARLERFWDRPDSAFRPLISGSHPRDEKRPRLERGPFPLKQGLRCGEIRKTLLLVDGRQKQNWFSGPSLRSVWNDIGRRSLASWADLCLRAPQSHRKPPRAYPAARLRHKKRPPVLHSLNPGECSVKSRALSILGARPFRTFPPRSPSRRPFWSLMVAGSSLAARPRYALS